MRTKRPTGNYGASKNSKSDKLKIRTTVGKRAKFIEDFFVIDDNKLHFSIRVAYQSIPCEIFEAPLQFSAVCYLNISACWFKIGASTVDNEEESFKIFL